MVRILKIAAGFLVLALTVGWLFFWSLVGALQERMLASATVESEHIAGSVYRLDVLRQGRPIGGAVAASIGDDGVLLVDTSVGQAAADKLRAALDGLGGGEVRYIVNTHPHPDHFRGNLRFSEATVVGHPRTRHWMSTRLKPVRFLPSVPPQPAAALPQLMVEESRTLQFNGEEVRILHFGAGHTDGDLVVHFPISGVAHVGDLFNGRGGNVSASGINGGDVLGMLAVFEKLLDYLPSETRLITGHGPPGETSSVADLRTYHELLRDTVEVVRQRLEQGRSVEEVVAEGVPLKWQAWFDDARPGSVMHGGPDGWLANLARELAKSR